MPDAVIVSTARTPLCKSWRGAFNMTHGATMGGHALRHAIERARLDPGEIEDVIMGCANPEGATGRNIARQIAIRAGCPGDHVGDDREPVLLVGPADDRDRRRSASSTGEGEIYAAGGVESISCVQNEMNTHMLNEEWIARPQAGAVLADAADRGIRGEDLRHLARAAGSSTACAASSAPRRRATAGKFDDEIAPMTTTMKVVDKATGAESTNEVTVAQDEGIRADTTYEGVSKIKPAIDGGVIAAGNASQFSDGAGVCVVMSDEGGGEPGADAARRVPRLRRRRLRAERDGHRPGVRGAEAARSRPGRRSRTSISGS